MEDWDDYDDDDDYGYDDENEEDYITCPECGADVYDDSPVCPGCGWYVTPLTGWRPAWFLGGENQWNWRAGVVLMLIITFLIGILTLKF